MKKYYYKVVCMLCMMSSCKSKEQVVETAAYHDYQIECLGTNIDGTQTLKIWASGSNRADAIEQAKKTAVYEVTFSGIKSGSTSCNAYPVIDEANAVKKYEDYFNKFFSNGGAYKKYVSIQNQEKSDMEELKGKDRSIFGIIVNVNRSELRKHFEKDNIIVK
jgi:hypothetical protein